MSNKTTEKTFVAPRPGLEVRDPVTHKPLPAEGAAVPRSTYWLRRLADGDVVEAKPVAQRAASKTAPADGKRS